MARQPCFASKQARHPFRLSVKVPSSCLPGPIISIASPANGSGKTSLAAALVAAWPGSSAIKFTTVRKDGSNCPRSPKGCACHSLSGDFKIIDSPDVILQPRTDTWRLAQAGARAVLWCLTRPEAYPQLLESLGDRFDKGPILTEGNSVIPYLPGTRVLFVLRPDQPPHRYKDSTFALLEQARAVILNGASEGPVRFPWENQRPEIASRLRHLLESRPTLRADLRCPLHAENLEDLCAAALLPRPATPFSLQRD